MQWAKALRRHVAAQHVDHSLDRRDLWQHAECPQKGASKHEAFAPVPPADSASSCCLVPCSQGRNVTCKGRHPECVGQLGFRVLSHLPPGPAQAVHCPVCQRPQAVCLLSEEPAQK